jgi:hypothetical protein
MALVIADGRRAVIALGCRGVGLQVCRCGGAPGHFADSPRRRYLLNSSTQPTRPILVRRGRLRGTESQRQPGKMKLGAWRTNQSTAEWLRVERSGFEKGFPKARGFERKRTCWKQARHLGHTESTAAGAWALRGSGARWCRFLARLTLAAPIKKRAPAGRADRLSLFRLAAFLLQAAVLAARGSWLFFHPSLCLTTAGACRRVRGRVDRHRPGRVGENKRHQVNKGNQA